LPHDAFKRNAGTEVTTDILMLRKLALAKRPLVRREGSRGLQQRPRENFTINEYFGSSTGNDARQDAFIRADVSGQ